MPSAKSSSSERERRAVVGRRRQDLAVALDGVVDVLQSSPRRAARAELQVDDLLVRAPPGGSRGAGCRRARSTARRPSRAGRGRGWRRGSRGRPRARGGTWRWPRSARAELLLVDARQAQQHLDLPRRRRGAWRAPPRRAAASVGPALDRRRRAARGAPSVCSLPTVLAQRAREGLEGLVDLLELPLVEVGDAVQQLDLAARVVGVARPSPRRRR